mmetsp:Transcript_4608/g.20941  ORF Transcript_4608/g.20941 Transcript_4608/m.20941 type:complete len:212 (+) Transcript_4608:307-942(+)
MLRRTRRRLRRRHRHRGCRSSQGEGQRHHSCAGRRKRRALRAVLHPAEADALAQHVGGRGGGRGAAADGMGRRARGRHRAREWRPRGRALLLADAALHGSRVHGQRRLHPRGVPNALAPYVRSQREKTRGGRDAKFVLHVPPGRLSGRVRADHDAVRVRGGAARGADGSQRGGVLPQAVHRQRSQHVLRILGLPPAVSAVGVYAQDTAHGR